MSPWRPLSEQGGSDPRPVAESLDGVARKFGAPRAAVLAAVFTGWEEIVGASVAAHTRPMSLRRGVLTIGTEQPAWASQLRYLGPDLLQRVASVLGEGLVERVEVKVVPQLPA
jgi:predicted nucleic acid-binding Zn ribbon protein